MMPNNAARNTEALPPANYDEIRAAHAAGLSLVQYRDRLAGGQQLEPDTGDEARLEKAEQLEVQKVFRAFGARVYWLSQARAAKQTPGLGDLFVIFPALVSFWWESKRQKGGRISEAQQEFHELCTGVREGSWHYFGGRREAEDLVIALGLACRDEASGALEPSRQIRAEP